MSSLERATHICLIAVSLISMGLLLEKRFSSPAKPQGAPQLIGSRLIVPGMNWKAAHVNAVIFMSTQCRYCAASMPFYRRIAEQRGEHPDIVRLSILSMQPPDDMKALLDREQISVDEVYPAPRSTGLSRTPTLLIVDGAGIVRKAYIGLLDSAKEQEVLEIVRSGVLNRG